MTDLFQMIFPHALFRPALQVLQISFVALGKQMPSKLQLPGSAKGAALKPHRPAEAGVGEDWSVIEVPAKQGEAGSKSQYFLVRSMLDTFCRLCTGWC